MANQNDRWWETLPPEIWGQQASSPMAQATIGSYTGAGADGVVQPGMPTGTQAVVGGKVTEHEGEVKVPLPGGRVMVLPRQEVQRLAAKYAGRSVGGMQKGGLFTNIKERFTTAIEKAGARTSAVSAPADVITSAPQQTRPTPTPEPAAVPVSAPPDVSIGAPTPTRPTTAQPRGAPGGKEMAPDIVDVGAPKVPAGPTGKDYTQTGMDVLSGVATGESPMLEGYWNRVIGQQAGAGAARTAGLKQELAMGGLGADQMTTAMASRARDVEAERGELYGSLAESAAKLSIGAAESLAGLGTTQQRIDLDREKFADDQGWREYDEMIAAGDYQGASEKYKDITGKSLDVGKLEEGYSWTQKDQAFREASVYLAAGDYEGFNKALTDAGLQPMDVSKLEANDLRGLITDIDETIAGLGDDADPRLLAYYGAMKGNLISKIAASYDVDTSAMTVTDPDTGESVPIKDLLTAVDDPDNATSNAIAVLNKISTDVATWYEETEGGITLQSQLQIDPTGSALIDRMEAGDEDSAEEFGNLVGASRAQAKQHRLSDPQKEILKKYGLYDDVGNAQAEQAAVEGAKGTIEEQIALGNYTYGDLNENTRNLIDEKTFDEMATKSVMDKIEAAGGVISAETNRSVLSDVELDILQKSGDSRYVVKGGAKDMLSQSLVYWATSGRNNWRLTDEAKSWFANNKGKIVEMNGKSYIVYDSYSPGGGKGQRHKVAYITLWDISTGEEVKLNNAGGNVPGSKQYTL